MANLNKVLLIGNLTRDPELRYTPQGTAVAEIGVAVNRTFGQGESRQEETTFIDVTVWQRQAEVIAQYLKKGSPIFIEGRLKLDSWQNQEGQKRSKLKVVLDSFQFLDRPTDRGGGGGAPAGARGGSSYPHADPPDQGGSGAPPGVDYGAGQPAPDGAPPPEHGKPEGMGLGEGEIPF